MNQKLLIVLLTTTLLVLSACTTGPGQATKGIYDTADDSPPMGAIKVKDPAKSNKGSLYLSTIPSGATVYFDLSSVVGGTTPLRKGFTKGNHRVKIEYEGYITEERSFMITAGKTTYIEVIMEQDFPVTGEYGEVHITSYPREARADIMFDFQNVGRISTVLEQVSAGDHVVNVTTSRGGGANYENTALPVVAGMITMLDVLFLDCSLDPRYPDYCQVAGEIELIPMPVTDCSTIDYTMDYNDDLLITVNDWIVFNSYYPSGNILADVDEDGIVTRGDYDCMYAYSSGVYAFPPETSDCSLECDAYTPYCGDLHVDPGEQCDDGNQLPGDGCSATCQLELIDECGNGIANPGEQCDGEDLTGMTCEGLGFAGGTLSCTNNCLFDISQCTYQV